MYQVGYFLTRNACCYPERTALVADGVELTYGALNAAANRLANAFSGLGVSKGDRVAYLFRNGVEWILIWWAAQKIGAAAVPLNVYLLTPELAGILDETQCKILLYQEEFADKAESLHDLCGALSAVICQGQTIPAGQLNWNDLCQNENDKEAQVSLTGEDESVILFTSGTTGAPKGVMRTQQMVRDHALMLAVENDNSHVPEIMLTHCPLYHAGGLLCVLKMAALCGTLVLVKRADPELILPLIEAHRVTQMLMIPPILYQRFIKNDSWRRYDLSSVREALCSAGRNSYDYSMTMFRLFPNCRVHPSWGSTEICSATGTLLSEESLRENPRRAESVGKLNQMVEIRLVDESGGDVPDGAVGEAIVRSSMVFNGYLNRKDLTEKYLKGGWFHTEDLMRRDADGYYYLVDRMKDMIKSGGENVYAQEVETVLQKHPAILDCAVIGVPDDCLGEAVAAAIVLTPGHRLTADELLEFSKKHLESYKKPRYWALLEELPVNNIGKLQKSILRENAGRYFDKIVE